MIHYTGYHVSDMVILVRKLNAMVIEAPRKSLTTVITKYSHK